MKNFTRVSRIGKRQTLCNRLLDLFEYLCAKIVLLRFCRKKIAAQDHGSVSQSDLAKGSGAGFCPGKPAAQPTGLSFNSRSAYSGESISAMRFAPRFRFGLKRSRGAKPREKRHELHKSGKNTARKNTPFSNHHVFQQPARPNSENQPHSTHRILCSKSSVTR